MLTSIEMAVLPGCALLYGSLFGPVVDSVFQAKQLPFELARIREGHDDSHPHSLRPCSGDKSARDAAEKRLKSSPTFAKEKLKALGSINAKS